MAIIFNSDVAGICRRIDTFVKEMVESQSQGVTHMIKADQVRLAGYLTSIDVFAAWVTSQPQLDLPKTHPQDSALPDPPVVPDMENNDVKDAVILLSMAREELRMSQSASLASGLVPFDMVRLTAIVTKVRQLLETYIVTQTPLDMPESAVI